MTKRKIDTYEDALKDFALLFKKRVRLDIKAWNALDPKTSSVRERAYDICISELKTALENNGLELDDIGLGGYEVPKAKDVTNE